MRLLILFISFLVSQISDAQILNASSPYRVRATASCSYLLDQYSGAAAAYSLRLLDCDYAGPLVRIRRSSDNTESDINADANGNLDTASLKTFVGTGGTDDGFVVTWYNQGSGGSTYDATQATSGNQPKIMDNGVIYRLEGDPSIYFLSTSDNILMASFSGVAITAHSVFAVFAAPSGKGFGRVVSTRASGRADYQDYAIILANSTYTAFGSYTSSGFVAGRTTSTTDANLYAAIHTGSEIQNSVDGGSNATSANTLSLTIIRYTIGAAATSTDAKNDGNITGYVSEVICYQSDQNSNKSGILSNINTYYTIY